jgi:hypothetical protein
VVGGQAGGSGEAAAHGIMSAGVVGDGAEGWFAQGMADEVV